MRISDWSSDVCSSDLAQRAVLVLGQRAQAFHPVAVVGIDQAVALQQRGAMDVAADDAVEAARARVVQAGLHEALDVALGSTAARLEELRQRPVAAPELAGHEHGSASWRERVCQYV